MAKTTRLPVLPWATKTMPVWREPGSILHVMGWVAMGLVCLRMMVNGNCLNTAALPALSNCRALAGAQGMAGFPW